MTRFAAALLLVASTAAWEIEAAARAQTEVPLEYQVKAVYLFNFTRFVEWPDSGAPAAPLTICVAATNPFGPALAETLRGEQVNGRPLEARVVVNQAAGCDVLFVPRGVAHDTYLRAARGRPVLTVGESPGFLAGGGMVNFVLEDGKVRFEIDANAAAGAKLRISSRLLRLARTKASDAGVRRWHAR